MHWYADIDNYTYISSVESYQNCHCLKQIQPDRRHAYLGIPFCVEEFVVFFAATSISRGVAIRTSMYPVDTMFSFILKPVIIY